MKNTLPTQIVEAVVLDDLPNSTSFPVGTCVKIDNAVYKIRECYSARRLASGTTHEAFIELYENQDIVSGYLATNTETGASVKIYEYSCGSLSEAKPTGFYDT